MPSFYCEGFCSFLFRKTRLLQNENCDSCEKQAIGTENTGIRRIPAGICNLAVKLIFDKVNPMMTQFLKLFGVDELNGLSPFAAANINSPQDLLSLIKAFFCAPKKDTRDCGGGRC
jgi:hypothetical protein